MSRPVALPVATGPDLASYDTIVVAFSGGKDSLACLLHLLDCGVPRGKIELWHHRVDGAEGSTLMDWACTEAYCSAVADALGVAIFYSWLEGGFERELLRRDTPKARTRWEERDEQGSLVIRGTGGAGKPNTRGKFPQVSADLRTRYCSPYLKIDVCAAALRSERFCGRRTLVVTGERAEESPCRAKYATFEPHRSDSRRGMRPERARWIDAWRPVHAWSEAKVWETIARHRVNPHPAYRAGFGRVSCQFCIFGSPNQWASARLVSPERFETIARLEETLGVTIQRKESVRARAARGTPYAMSEADLAACRATTFDEPVILDTWRMPAGAGAESAGPT